MWLFRGDDDMVPCIYYFIASASVYRIYIYIHVCVCMRFKSIKYNIIHSTAV